MASRRGFRVRGGFQTRAWLCLVAAMAIQGCGAGNQGRSAPESTSPVPAHDSAGRLERISLLGGVVSSPMGRGASRSGAINDSMTVSTATLAALSDEPPVGVGVVATHFLNTASPENRTSDLETLIGESPSAYEIEFVTVSARQAVRLHCRDEPGRGTCADDAPLAILCIELDDGSWAVLRYEGWPTRADVVSHGEWKSVLDWLVSGLSVHQQVPASPMKSASRLFASALHTPWSECFDGVDYRLLEFREVVRVGTEAARVVVYIGGFPEAAERSPTPGVDAGAWMDTGVEHDAVVLFDISRSCAPCGDDGWRPQFLQVSVHASSVDRLREIERSMDLAAVGIEACVLQCPTLSCMRARSPGVR